MKFKELRESLMLHEMIYMNTGQACPSPSHVLRRINDTLKQEALVGPGSPKGLSLARSVEDIAKNRIAGFIGAQADDVQLTHSTREGISIVLFGIAWNPGDELLVCDLEHSSLLRPAAVLAERFGVRVVEVSISPQSLTSEILERITSGLSSKTRLVALSHIQYGCGLRMPIKEIAQAAHAWGTVFLVDGAQSVGQILVDVKQLECDFYCLSGQKWLMGPVATGALFVRKESRALLEPLFSANSIEGKRSTYKPPLARFSLTSQNPGLLAGFAEAVSTASEYDIIEIERRIISLASRLRERFGSLSGCSVLSSDLPETCSGIVTVHCDGWSPLRLVGLLADDFNIIARAVSKPNGVRFCTSYFNSEQDIDLATAAVRKLVTSGTASRT